MRENESTVLLIILALAVIATCVAFMILFEVPDAGGQTMLSPIPRPTLPAETPSYEVFLPIVNQHNLTPVPTPRPTLEG